MMRKDDDDVIELVRAVLPLDRRTMRWLDRLQRVTGDAAADMIARMLRDIRVDDEQAHDEQARTIN